MASAPFGLGAASVLWVGQDDLRQVFNTLDIAGRAARGELKHHVQGYNNHLGPKQRAHVHEPRCTRSQMVLFTTLDNQPVALAHQYRRPDASLGASGRPDPKKLFLRDHILAYSPNQIPVPLPPDYQPH